MGRPGRPTGPSAGLSTGLVAQSLLTGLSTGSLERLFSPEVARERLREAIWDDLGLILGRPNLEKHRFYFRKTVIFRKSTFSLSEATWRRLGDPLGRLGAPFGPLGRSSWPSEAPLGSLGALPGRSQGASGALLGGFLALLGRTWGHPVAPDPSRDKFWEDFGSTWGSIWVGLVIELGEFGSRLGM